MRFQPGPLNPRWRGNAASPNAKRDRARRAYQLACCERCGAAGANRHHRDRDPGNNEPENIEMLCQECHLREHGGNPGERKWALILNEILPDEVRAALDGDASAQNVTLNDVAGAILAKHFGEVWKYSGKPYRVMASQFKLRVPEPLHLKLRLTAALDPRTVVRGIVISVLANHYGLEAVPTTRRPRSVPS